MNPTNVDSVVVGKGNQVNTVTPWIDFSIIYMHKCPIFLVINAILHRLLVLTTNKPHVTHLYNQVTIKPGQRLYMVNQLYPYTVKFTEEMPRSAADTIKASKRPHPANITSRSDHHSMDSPPPKKTPTPSSDKSVSYFNVGTGLSDSNGPL